MQSFVAVAHFVLCLNPRLMNSSVVIHIQRLDSSTSHSSNCRYYVS